MFSLFFITIDNLDECGVVGVGVCYANTRIANVIGEHGRRVHK
jgi:hypothetical protein